MSESSPEAVSSICPRASYCCTRVCNSGGRAPALSGESNPANRSRSTRAVKSSRLSCPTSERFASGPTALSTSSAYHPASVSSGEACTVVVKPLMVIGGEPSPWS